MKSILICVATFALAATTCQADIINIDMGRLSANAAGGGATTGNYNNFTEGDANNTVKALINDTGAASGFSAELSLTNIPNDVLGVSAGNYATAANFSTVSSAFVGTIAQSAYEDGLFLRDEIGDGPTEFVDLIFSGLSSTDVFDFAIFASRDTNGNVTDFSLTGATTLADSAQPDPTQTTTYDPLVVFTGMQADANGEIVLRTNALGNSGSGALNFIQINTSTATIPEPSSACLLIAGLAGICVRRRR